MDPIFAVLSLLVMVGMYQVIKHTHEGEDDLAAMFQGVMTQAIRYMHIRLQHETTSKGEWRPSVIMVNDRTFDRGAPLSFLRWVCHRHGFGTYLHYIQGNLDRDAYTESQGVKQRLLEMARDQDSDVYMDTIVSPSMISAMAQSLQIPGVSGLSNNAVLFEFSKNDRPEIAAETVEHCLFAAATEMTLLVLRHGDFHFGERKSIHIWLTWNDQDNANLMLLLSYILLGHPDWQRAEITVCAALPGDQLDERRDAFTELIAAGRLPVSEKNLRFLPIDDVASFRGLVQRMSSDADLVVIGFDLDGLRARREAVFTNHATLKDVLFVHTPQPIEMV
jgi:hypothetical protein